VARFAACQRGQTRAIRAGAASGGCCVVAPADGGAVHDGLRDVGDAVEDRHRCARRRQHRRGDDEPGAGDGTDRAAEQARSDPEGDGVQSSRGESAGADQVGAAGGGGDQDRQRDPSDDDQQPDLGGCGDRVGQGRLDGCVVRCAHGIPRCACRRGGS
jgi:hypothetical protein